MKRRVIGLIKRNVVAFISLVCAITAVSAWWAMAYEEETGTSSSAETLWVGSEPPSVEGLSPVDMRAAMEPFRQQAKQAEADSQWELGSRRYLDIAVRLPDDTYKQNVLIKAGKCLAQAGRVADAIKQFDEVVAVGGGLLATRFRNTSGDENSRPLWKSRRITAKDNIHRALCEKIMAYDQAGDSNSALQAIDSMYAWFPAYNNHEEVIPIEARLTGKDSQQMIQESQAATSLAEQARQAMKQEQLDTAYELANTVLAQYPLAGAAWAAKDIKAEALWKLKRYEDSRQVYKELTTSLSVLAPDSELARRAIWHCALLDVRDLSQVLITSRFDPQYTEDDWQHAHELCEAITSRHPDDSFTAEIDLLQVELYFWQGKYEEAVEAAEQAIERHQVTMAKKTGMEGSMTKRAVMLTHYFEGFSLLNLDRPDEAVPHFTLVVEECRSDPYMMHKTRPIAASGCYGLWIAYSRMGAESERDEAKALLLSKWPNTIPAIQAKQSKQITNKR